MKTQLLSILLILSVGSCMPLTKPVRFRLITDDGAYSYSSKSGVDVEINQQDCPAK